MFPDLYMGAAALSDEIQKERERQKERTYL
jgi:hypothetical protein